MDKPLIVAHGGTEASGYRDVLDALDAAITAGADMFEFDVRRTGDGELVVHHEADVGNRPLAGVDYSTAAREASRLGYHLPRLREILDATRGRLHLDVELKEAGYEDDVVRSVTDGRFGFDEIIVTSFELAAIAAVRAAHPRVKTGLLVYDVSGATALQMFRRCGCTLLGPDYRILDDDTLEEAAASAIPLVPWTVNEPAVMRRLLDAKAVKGVITDRPALGIDIRHELCRRSP